MKVNSFLKILAIIFLSCQSAVAFERTTIYVSADKAGRNRIGSKDAPYVSLDEALKDGKLFKQTNDTAYIMVSPGDYYLDAPCVIDCPFGRPVIIRSAEKEKPRFIGGIHVSGWQKCGDGLYRAYIPEVARYGLNPEQLYVNGRRATLARTPNEGWFFVKGSKEIPIMKSGESPLAEYAVQQIDFHVEDWMSLKGTSHKELGNMKFRFYHKWDITRKSPSHIEADSARVYLSGRGMKPWNPVHGGSRYFMYDYMAALDRAGEWYLNRNTGYLYYMPHEGEDMGQAYCILPVLRQWIQVNGSPEAPIKDLILEGLSFQYSSYRIPTGGEEPAQAAANTEAAMHFDFVENVTIRDCEVLHTGGYGIWMARECHRNRIEHCYLADLGAGGIKIGEPYFRNSSRPVTSGNVVDNNIVTDAGNEQPCGVGIALFHTSDNQVTHNEISDLLYSGISVGWVWGYNREILGQTSVLNEQGEMELVSMLVRSPSVRNQILYNHVHHIGWGELSDMGAIYTLGESEGTKVSYNFIHDIWSYDYGGWGLYTDEGSTGVEISHNLVLRCKSGGFHQHYGKNNRIENNIFGFGHYHQLQLTRSEPHLSLHFRHNIIIFDRGEALLRSWDKAHVDMDYNLYWHTDGCPPLMMGKSFKEWIKEKEPHSIHANPCFRDVERDDYTFISKKNIRKIRFKPFDYSKAGVYGDEEWLEKAEMSSSKVVDFKRKANQRMER